MAIRLRIGSLLLIAALIPACGSSTEESGSGNPPPVDTFAPIAVFLADRDVDDQFELYAVDATGTETRKISGTMVPGGDVVNFAWSPDRKWVAFVADRDVNDNFRLYIVSAQGGEVFLIDADPLGTTSTSFLWAPDSSRVAVLMRTLFFQQTELWGVVPGETAAVRIAPASGDTQQVIDGVAWAPDSSRVAWRRLIDNGQTSEIDAANGDGTAFIRLSPPQVIVGSRVTGLKWAPDASRVAFVGAVETPDIFELFSVKPDGTDRKKVSTPPEDSIGPFDWSPDAARIAYGSDDKISGFALRIADPDGANRVDVPGSQYNPFLERLHWSPTGDWVAFSFDAAGHFILMSTADGATITYLATDPAGPPNSNYDFAWRPDGFLVSYVDNGSPPGSTDLVGSDPYGAYFQQYSNAGIDHTVTSPVWGPDGVRIAYLSNQFSSFVRELWVVAGGSNSGFLLPEARSKAPVAGGSVKSFQWTKDSQKLVYAGDLDTFEKVELYLVSPTGAPDSIKISGSMVAGGNVLGYEAR